MVLVARAIAGPDPSESHGSSARSSGRCRPARSIIGLDLRVDGLAALVALAVTVVALAVQVYSTAYLKGDPRYSSYAAFVSLFTAAMLLVVFADDLMVLLVGWEVMGVCSYFLIGHHWEQEGARAGAVKAFLITRLGDVGFLFGIFVLASAPGTFSITGVLDAGLLRAARRPIATLLLLCGVVGKSAQFPLHTWLPDAMAGPTPISALIHAATMVAAGIYLVARLYDVFLRRADDAGGDGGDRLHHHARRRAGRAGPGRHQAGARLLHGEPARLHAGRRSRSARPLAASFHLLTHAAFKALLFLAAGSVIHAVGTNLMPDMGGLRRLMPVTFVTMTVGLAALAGVPPFAGLLLQGGGARGGRGDGAARRGRSPPGPAGWCSSSACSRSRSPRPTSPGCG